ncbi:hypothetical protein [Natrarchaeobaculum sulfurireducens]|uniref:Uncharacterized protein n=1 Tax=Natrarchaeobaculum sulfurireducens TaxID=2044521 RepID=A0A346PHK9_9EURY|nr:hypothetical protein [Natrarchaeobaculum sulfurireducens]AXR79004.1 hypothetical protein AArc1_2691 [Natrarchaeobaculum sulfurireducens]
MMDLIQELAAQSDAGQSVAVEVLVGTRQAVGTIDHVESEPTITGVEYKVHVDINGRRIVCSPGQLRLA